MKKIEKAEDVKPGEFIKLSGFRADNRAIVYGIVQKFENISSDRKLELHGEEESLKNQLWFSVIKTNNDNWTTGLWYSASDSQNKFAWKEVSVLNADERTKILKEKMLDADE